MTKPNISRQDASLMLSAAYPSLFSSKIILFGLRGFFDPPGGNKRGIYDDAIGIFTPEQFLVYNGNTDPSIDRKGIAVLQDGVYDYIRGLHGIHHLNLALAEDKKILDTLQTTGKDHPAIEGRILPYWAFRQDSPVTVLRDGAPTPETMTDRGSWPWIDIHRGGYNTTSSEGCQTIHPDFWQAFFWDIATVQMEKYKVTRVPYALLTKKAA